MELGLRDKVAVVTGASQGIGLSVVRGLVAEGAHVVAGARHSSDALDALADGGHVDIVTVDLSEPSGPAALVERAGDRLDILVNNVGAAGLRLDGFLHVTDDDWAASFNLNVMAAVRATRQALPVMLAGGQGIVVTVSSVNAFLPDPVVIDYGASKAALTNLCKSLSKEFGPRGIRINTVSPGPVATDLWLGPDGVAASVSRVTGGDPSTVADSAVAGAATGRFTTPDEVADVVLFLASERGANITGADVTIDGGLITTL